MPSVTSLSSFTRKETEPSLTDKRIFFAFVPSECSASLVILKVFFPVSNSDFLSELVSPLPSLRGVLPPAISLISVFFEGEVFTPGIISKGEREGTTSVVSTGGIVSS